MKLTNEQYTTIINLLKKSDTWILKDGEIFNTCAKVKLHYDTFLNNSLVFTMYDPELNYNNEDKSFVPVNKILLCNIIEVSIFKHIILFYYMYKVTKKVYNQKKIQDDIDRNKIENEKSKTLDTLLPKIKECING